MEHDDARRWAEEWVDAWNSHDLDRVLGHFDAEAAFSSPLVPVIAGRQNPLVGHGQLRAYWAEGLRRFPDLRFTLEQVFVGADGLAIAYRNERARSAIEVLALGPTGRAQRGWAFYGLEADRAAPDVSGREVPPWPG